MPPGPSVRILLFHPSRPVSRATIDWIVERQRYARVIIPPSLQRPDLLPPRTAHEPFASPDPYDARPAAELSALLAPREGPARAAAEAAVLALFAGGAIIAADTGLFRDLIPLSSWSMNLPKRPTDGLLVQHIGIAGRLPEAWRDAAADALEAVLSGDASQVVGVTRARRLRARRDGPERFARLAKRSAGLRPAIVYIDLLASFAAAGPPSGEWLRGFERSRAEALLSVTAAVFV